MTLTVLALLTLLPLHWFGDDWASMQWILIASAALLLSGWPRLICVVGPMVGIPVWTTLQAVSQHGTLASDAYIFVYYFVGLAGGSACLYGATHLVRAVDELFATRAELAASMIGREHGRLSRDLHDLLGQSLAAVSLKGDLALALLRGGSRSEAETEIRSLTHLARQALHDIRHVVRDRHSVSLHAETQGARALLAAAGIDATIDAKLENLPGPIDELLGWAAREGVTNMLRHSEASSCSIRAIRRAGTVVLEIINDGAATSSETGTGIAGLAERARALAGSVSAGDTGDGHDRLLVQVPEPEARR
jgi:two-component system sensor histidine kinase DesK